MKLILSQHCKSLTGSLSRSHGYYIRRIGDITFTQRSKHFVPADGHFRFILECAKLTRDKLYIVDFILTHRELVEALIEAGRPDLIPPKRRNPYNAQDILYLFFYFL